MQFFRTGSSATKMVLVQGKLDDCAWFFPSRLTCQARQVLQLAKWTYKHGEHGYNASTDSLLTPKLCLILSFL